MISVSLFSFLGLGGDRVTMCRWCLFGLVVGSICFAGMGWLPWPRARSRLCFAVDVLSVAKSLGE